MPPKAPTSEDAGNPVEETREYTGGPLMMRRDYGSKTASGDRRMTQRVAMRYAMQRG